MKKRQRRTAYLVAVTHPDESVQVYAARALTGTEACAAVAAQVPAGCPVALAGALSRAAVRRIKLKRSEVQLV